MKCHIGGLFLLDKIYNFEAFCHWVVLDAMILLQFQLLPLYLGHSMSHWKILMEQYTYLLHTNYRLKIEINMTIKDLVINIPRYSTSDHWIQVPDIHLFSSGLFWTVGAAENCHTYATFDISFEARERKPRASCDCFFPCP